MPLQDCRESGRPGYRWGEGGHCYTYSPNDEPSRKEAKRQAIIQATAIEANRARKLDTAALDRCEKEYTPEMAVVPAPSADLMAKINALAGEEVPPEALYVRQGRVCNDQYDRSHERFPVSYLERFAQTLPGRSLLVGHDKSRLGEGAWVDAKVEKDAATGVHHLVGTFFMPKIGEAAVKVRMGIAKDLSIGFKAAGRICDLCGEPYDGAKGCGHVKGQEYDGRTCTATYGGDLSRVEALEASLVHVGCQYGAQVIGRKGLGEAVIIEGDFETVAKESDMETGEKLAQYEAKIDELETKLKAATAYEEQGRWAEKFLRSGIQRMENAVAGNDTAGEQTLKILGESPTLSQLETCYERAKTAFNAKFSGSMQSQPRADGEADQGAKDAPKPEGEKAALPFDPTYSYRRSFAGGD